MLLSHLCIQAEGFPILFKEELLGVSVCALVNNLYFKGDSFLGKCFSFFKRHTRFPHVFALGNVHITLLNLQLKNSILAAGFANTTLGCKVTLRFCPPALDLRAGEKID